MSKGSSGSFSGTKGANKAFSDFPKTVHSGRQDKHIIGSNNYTAGRSVFSGTTRQAEKLIKEYSGTGQSLGSNRERVDFGKQIGYYVDPQTNERMPTTMGIIHYSKDGAHIVPARPKDKTERRKKMYLNAFEEKIISTFFKNLNQISGKTLLLKWDTGCVSAIFDTCFEDMDDETEEEFYSFSFIVSSKEGNPPILVSNDNYCLLNYKNFPKTITLDSIKIN